MYTSERKLEKDYTLSLGACLYNKGLHFNRFLSLLDPFHPLGTKAIPFRREQ